MLYEKLLRPILFRMDPESAHEKMASLLSVAGALPLAPAVLSWACGGKTPGLETKVLGLKFPNPVGLAAGFDKDCRLAAALPSLGFGFLEVGSITLKPQPGNPKPRLFRYPEEHALINRMGFNSEGAEAAVGRLKFLRRDVPLGINLGLNAGVSKEDAPAAYAETFNLLAPYGDYFVVNVSSPNTTGLRALQERLHLEKILAAIADKNPAKIPVLVKIDPDGSEDHLADILGLLKQSASGIVVSNTTTSRPWASDAFGETKGGLSGAPLREPSTRLIRKIHTLTEGCLPIIGVGGIFTGWDAFEKIRAGASLVQVYTGLVYRGPGMVRKVQKELAQILKQSGFRTVAEAVGTGGQAS